MNRKVVKRFIDWQLELFGNKNNPHDWFIDGIECSNCGFPFSSLTLNINYCPKCGGYIEGVINPKPPINEI